MAAGNGPGPSGTCRSSSTGLPPGRGDAPAFFSPPAAVSVAAANIARTKIDLRIARLYQRAAALQQAISECAILIPDLTMIRTFAALLFLLALALLFVSNPHPLHPLKNTLQIGR